MSREFAKKMGATCNMSEAVAWVLTKYSKVHKDTCLKMCNNGTSELLETEQEAVEKQIRNMLLPYKDTIKGVTFHYDPRGYTVELNLVSGESNSFTGGWIIPTN